MLGCRLQLALALVLAGASCAAAEPAIRDASHATALHGDLLHDAADGTLDRHSLIESMLIAEGVNDREALRTAISRFDQFVPPAAACAGDLALRTTGLLDFLHRSVLLGDYSAQRGSLRTALAGGPYNCLASAVLFRALAERSGLPAELIASPDHVMAIVDESGVVLLVETTLRGERAVRALPPVPLTSERWRRLADPHSLALAYYNRGVAELRHAHFAPAAASNLAALRLDPDYGPARMNLDVALNNWAVRLAGEGRFGEAVRLLSACESVAARRAAEQNRRYIAYRRSMAAAGPSRE